MNPKLARRGMQNGSYKGTIEQRFWEKVKKTDGCWLWQGCRNQDGYGHLLHSKGKVVGAHRLSFTFVHGEIPKGLFVCHTCDVPACVRPSHLFLGTPKDNTQDAARKGKMRGAPRERNFLHLNPHTFAGEKSPNSKFSNADAEAIRREYIPRKVTRQFLADKYGVGKASIDRVLAGKTFITDALQVEEMLR